MTVPIWTAAFYAFATILTAGWQAFAGWGVVDLAASPFAVGDLCAGARRAQVTVIVSLVVRGVADFWLASAALATGGGMLTAVGSGAVGAVSRGSGRPVAGWFMSSAEWTPIVTGVFALASTLYLLATPRLEPGQAKLKPWVARLTPITAHGERRDLVTRQLESIRRYAREAGQQRNDDCADRAAKALAYVMPLPPDVFERRVEAVVSVVYAPRRERDRARSRRRFAPVLRRHMDHFRQDLDDGQEQSRARSFWYLAVLRELDAYGGPDALPRLTAGLTPLVDVAMPDEVARELVIELEPDLPRVRDESE